MNILNQYIFNHIDFGTLAILFCLMAVVAGFTELGYMDAMAGGLVKRAGTQGKLLMSLTMVCFIISMFVTNDVALIVMVPFTIQILQSITCNHKLIKIVVLETIAANLGSMLTPIGNPQNVYLYQAYKMNLGEFFLAVLPFATVSAVLLVGILLLDKDRKESVLLQENSISKTVLKVKNKTRQTVVYSILFVVCLLTVLDFVPYYITLVVVIVGIFMCNYTLFNRVDYGLLIKFVVLFILVGNLADISFISSRLDKIVAGNEFLVGIGLSQILSNVPTAIMLSGFTMDGMELLQGVNVGGLGTLIASMASMISLEYYGKTVTADKKKYVLHFTVYNMAFLVVMVFVKILMNIWIGL